MGLVSSRALLEPNSTGNLSLSLFNVISVTQLHYAVRSALITNQIFVVKTGRDEEPIRTLFGHQERPDLRDNRKRCDTKLPNRPDEFHHHSGSSGALGSFGTVVARQHLTITFRRSCSEQL
jgi:hypothetical protein